MKLTDLFNQYQELDKLQQQISKEKSTVLNSINEKLKNYFYFNIKDSKFSKNPLVIPPKNKDFDSEDEISFEFFIPIYDGSDLEFYHLSYDIQSYIGPDSIETYLPNTWNITKLSAQDHHATLELLEIHSNKETSFLSNTEDINNLKLSDFIKKVLKENITPYLNEFAANKGYESKIIANHLKEPVYVIYYNDNSNDTTAPAIFSQKIKEDIERLLFSIENLTQTDPKGAYFVDESEFKDFLNHTSILNTNELPATKSVGL